MSTVLHASRDKMYVISTYQLARQSTTRGSCNRLQNYVVVPERILAFTWVLTVLPYNFVTEDIEILSIGGKEHDCGL